MFSTRSICICTLAGSHALHRHSCACPVTVALVPDVTVSRCLSEMLRSGLFIPPVLLRAPPRYSRPRRGHFRLYHATDRRMTGGVKPHTELTETRSLSRPCAPLLHAPDRGPRLLLDHHVDRAHDDVQREPTRAPHVCAPGRPPEVADPAARGDVQALSERARRPAGRTRACADESGRRRVPQGRRRASAGTAC
jgi:hypothetical protein